MRYVLRKFKETYNVAGHGEFDVVLLPDAPCISLQSLSISRLAKQVLLDLEPVTATIIALDGSRGLAEINLGGTRVLWSTAVSKSLV